MYDKTSSLVGYLMVFTVKYTFLIQSGIIFYIKLIRWGFFKNVSQKILQHQ